MTSLEKVTTNIELDINEKITRSYTLQKIVLTDS